MEGVEGVVGVEGVEGVVVSPVWLPPPTTVLWPDAGWPPGGRRRHLW